MVWLHVARAERLPAVLQLATRLIAQRERLHVLITAPRHMAGPRRLKEGITWHAFDNPSQRDATRFIQHFAPDLCVWTSGDLIPVLIDAASQANVPLVLIDAVADGFGQGRGLDLLQPRGALLRMFSAIMASDVNTATRLERLGALADSIAVTGPLQEGSAALPHDTGDLDELHRSIGPRPVWLAAMAQPEEAHTILQAHRNAMRFSQRLVLVLVPDKPDMADDMEALAKAEGLRFVRWSEGDLPDDMTEVILADTVGEMGLWYRLAAVSFLASSLVPGRGGCDPFEPAALGSAVLYGPNCGRHLHAYSRLVEVGAARMVRDAESLTGALRHLLAPDKAASMSLAAWEVVSEGAEVADKVTDLIHDILDHAEIA